ncbi:hypothetical protein B4U80_04781 [Leptotrombidium deliense]|uniref:Uncharacterized protein n=1 Tax=Leptotrombidium deliense TaxID=299467 RepID=A0A443RTN1_9ACAR|nr:hypothetical protein B4U80_04781 [Leptotrombidium deliense]
MVRRLKSLHFHKLRSFLVGKGSVLKSISSSRKELQTKLYILSILSLLANITKDKFFGFPNTPGIGIQLISKQKET